MLGPFENGVKLISDHVHIGHKSQPWPKELEKWFSLETMDRVGREISAWPDYEPTPLHSLAKLAEKLQIGNLIYKDEAGRFGLGSFKALGGAYAVRKLVEEHGSDITITSATAGNHGRSLAWGAQQAGCKCRIVVHSGVSEERKKAMEAYGATVDRIEGNYDESVRIAAADAKKNGWHLVSDTSWPGYTKPPRQIMSGYTLMADEILAALPKGKLPTHLFVQGGVGGLACGLLTGLWLRLGEKCPRTIVVEPALAPCLTESAKAGEPVTVEITQETSMAGLSCGEPSLIAWDVISRGASDFMTLSEDGVAPAVRLLASRKTGGPEIVAGESAVAGLIALIAAAQDGDLRDKLGLDNSSSVLVVGSEGATDPEAYARIMAEVD